MTHFENIEWFNTDYVQRDFKKLKEQYKDKNFKLYYVSNNTRMISFTYDEEYLTYYVMADYYFNIPGERNYFKLIDINSIENYDKFSNKLYLGADKDTFYELVVLPFIINYNFQIRCKEIEKQKYLNEDEKYDLMTNEYEKIEGLI